jgi:glycerophosphoryl diester phosphodiesterase
VLPVIRLRQRWALIGAGFLGCVLSLYLFNASWLANPPSGRPAVVAQRGLEQSYPAGKSDDSACTARTILPPTRDYIDNTVPSIAAALADGANIVEVDARMTRDHEFVLIHDNALDCRTNGSGLVAEHRLAELRKLDVGYGYTADGGSTFPLRGKGVGLMPTLAEVLQRFADRRFFVQIKDFDPAVADRLVTYLDAIPSAPWTRISFFGSPGPLARLKLLKPSADVWSAHAVSNCLFGYVETGWSGHVPHACDDGMIIIPVQQAWLIWGWPNRFLARMREHRTRVMLIGRMLVASRSFSRLDTAGELTKVPPGFDGLIWTDHIEVIGPLSTAP